MWIIEKLSHTRSVRSSVWKDASLAFYMLTVSGFQREISYTKYQERITILSCIYFTSIVLQKEKKLLSWDLRPTRGVHKTSRVKERVFNMSCFDRFNETEPLWWNKSKCSAHFFSYLTTLYRKYVLREIVWPSIACSQIILRGSWKKLHANKFFVTRCPPSIGSLRDLITWSTFGKHENSSLLKNFVSISWKSILK